MTADADAANCLGLGFGHSRARTADRGERVTGHPSSYIWDSVNNMLARVLGVAVNPHVSIMHAHPSFFSMTKYHSLGENIPILFLLHRSFPIKTCMIKVVYAWP